MTSYNWAKIGARIKEERKASDLTLEALAEKIGTSRQTISRWEKGEGVEITLNMLLRMCDIFECELGYLLCEYDCKTREATDIQNKTALSESAIVNLIANRSNKAITNFLSKLLEDLNSLYFLSSAYSIYKDKKASAQTLIQYAKTLSYSVEQEDIEADASVKIREADFELFRCQNLFLNFVQKEEQSNAKENNS